MTYLHELDSRKGEGLGKYVLAYAKNAFRPINPTSDDMISEAGDPGNRVYVRDLYISDASGLVNGGQTLFSYNLANTNAIGGSDRKTLQEGKLPDVIRKSLMSLTDLEHIGKIVQAVQTNDQVLEVKYLTATLLLSARQQSLWREQFETVFSFSEKKGIFVSRGESSVAKQKLAREYGYQQLIYAPSHVLKFLQLLYPSTIVTIPQLEADLGLKLPKKDTPIEQLMGSFQKNERSTPVDSETKHIMQRIREVFIDIFLPEFARLNLFNPLSHISLFEITQSNQQSAVSQDKLSVRYIPSYNSFDLSPDAVAHPSSLQTKIDTWVQMVNALFHTNTYTSETQGILSDLLAHALSMSSKAHSLSEWRADWIYIPHLAYT